MFQPHLHSAAFPHTQMSSLAAVTAALLQQSSTPALTPAPAQTSLPPTAVRSALTPASHQITPQSGPQPALPISTVQHQNTATAVLSQAKVSQKQGQACTPSSSKDLTADEPADQPVKSTQTLEPEVLKQLLEKSSNYRQLVNLWLQKLGGVTAVPLAKYLQVEGQTVLVNLAPFGGTARLPAPRSLGRSKGADEEVARRVWLEVLEMPYLEDQLDADKTVGQATSVSKKAGENTPADSIEVQAQLSSLHKSEGLPAEGGTPSSTNAEKEEILDPGNSFASRKLKPEVLQRIIRNSSNYRMLINSFMLRTNGPKPYTQCVTFEDESPDAEPMVSVDLGLLGKGRFTAPKDWGSKAADEELAKRVWTEVMQLPPMPQPDLKAPTAEDVQERPTTGGAQTEECGASKIACQAVEGALKQPGKGLKQQSQEQKANPSAPTPQVSIVSPMTWAQEDEHIALWSEEDIHYVCQNWARQFPTQIPDKDMQIDCRLLELIKNIQGSCMYVHDTMSKKGVPGPLTGDNIRRRYLAPLALRILQYVDGCNEEDSDVAAEERAFQQASGIPTTQHNPLPPSHIYTRPCRFFGKGFCRHGDKCRYSHNDVAVSSSYSYRRSPPRTHHSHPQHQHYTQRRGPSVQHDDR
uniref:C3H1-type domain-containing protein n=1 Tax=Heterosigma akashiwo TaxID=2829 RepID=A0A6V1K438_HETAK